MSSGTGAEVVRKFGGRLKAAVEYQRELLRAVDGKKRQRALETMLAEQFAFNIAVFWEVFLSELLLVYLTSEPKRFLGALKQRINDSLTAKFGNGVAKVTTFATPKRLSISRVSSFIDPRAFNITFTSAQALTSRANELLSAPRAKLFTLDTADSKFVDYVISLRNFLGHRSSASRRELQAAVGSLTSSDVAFQGAITNVGAYLKWRDAGGETRSVLIALRLKKIAEKFA